MATRDRKRYSESDIASIATTGNTDVTIIAPVNGKLSQAIFSSTSALAANDTNYVTFSITNLGQAGSGSAAMLAATDPNTTKATGGAGLSANTRRNLTVSSVQADIKVAVGDRLRVRFAATGTLAGAVAGSQVLLVWEKGN